MLNWSSGSGSALCPGCPASPPLSCPTAIIACKGESSATSAGSNVFHRSRSSSLNLGLSRSRCSVVDATLAPKGSCPFEKSNRETLTELKPFS